MRLSAMKQMEAYMRQLDCLTGPKPTEEFVDDLVNDVYEQYLHVKEDADPRALAIPKQVQELVFLLRESPGVERSKTGPYSNMGQFSIFQPRDFGAQKNQLLNLFGYKFRFDWGHVLNQVTDSQRAKLSIIFEDNCSCIC